jgi:hypothetical protein
MSVPLNEYEVKWRSGDEVIGNIPNLDLKYNEILAKYCKRFAIRPRDVPVSETGYTV